MALWTLLRVLSKSIPGADNFAPYKLKETIMSATETLQRKLDYALERSTKAETKIWEIFLEHCSHSVDPDSWEKLLEILGSIAELRGIDLNGIMERFKQEAMLRVKEGRRTDDTVKQKTLD